MAAPDRNDPVNVNEPEPGFDSGAGAGAFTGSARVIAERCSAV
ncbi:MAG TPA: hypothetical protein VLC54_15020 [Anaeromyxobacter sp.]|nr:hypothetical protein [Anaeromyxobacter sp.]